MHFGLQTKIKNLRNHPNIHSASKNIYWHFLWIIDTWNFCQYTVDESLGYQVGLEVLKIGHQNTSKYSTQKYWPISCHWPLSITLESTRKLFMSMPRENGIKCIKKCSWTPGFNKPVDCIPAATIKKWIRELHNISEAKGCEKVLGVKILGVW